MGEEKLQHSDQRGGTLAIDLGSTTTVVAYQGATSTTADLLNLPAICSRAGEIPSLVWESSQRPLIGRQVLESGLNDSVDSRLHRDFKGRIGQADAPEQEAARWAGEQLLQQIWSRLPNDLQVERLVLTAPVECYRAYRSWLLQACTTLPVAEIALVDEPTAAAMGAGLPAGSTLLVVDLGGSTLDLALVALEGGEGRAAPIAQLLRLGGRSLGDNSRQLLRTAKVLGKAGLRLGGRDIDRWIVDRCCPGQPASTPLLNAAERLKCRLSDTALAEREPLMELAVDEQEHVLSLSRSELNALLLKRGFGDALEQLLETCLAGGRRNNCSLEDLEGVVAVGGGAQLPLLRQWLSEHTAPAPLLTPPPVEAVALGALQLTPGVAIRDVLQHGVSLRFWDQRSNSHRWHPLFMAGQPWPSPAPLELVLAASRTGQSSVELVLGEPIAQGSHSVVFIDGLPTLQEQTAGEVSHQPWPGIELVLPLEPAGEQGEDCLRLRWSIDQEAQLQLEINDLRSGRKWSQPTLGAVR
ncbi:putative DnaK-type molecular chaperone (HSP70 family) [Synechococcus sp. WH 8109]|uniref:Hsp70 family protein n=1 Tax=Synechococcus sp. WH 8109 TaxID=166314 RepID=UPI0001B8DDFB|nr:Hsp70 family protein [Synechococcus sp. WH 8109]AHF64568.1 putative DnaK-type molecular chaperone (HSP70 family) [Synechococcus sp. WH 8109]